MPSGGLTMTPNEATSRDASEAVVADQSRQLFRGQTLQATGAGSRCESFCMAERTDAELCVIGMVTATVIEMYDLNRSKVNFLL